MRVGGDFSSFCPPQPPAPLTSEALDGCCVVMVEPPLERAVAVLSIHGHTGSFCFAPLFGWNNCDDCLVPEQTGLLGISQHSLLISCTVRFPLFPVSIRFCVPHCDARSHWGIPWDFVACLGGGGHRWLQREHSPERPPPTLSLLSRWGTATHSRTHCHHGIMNAFPSHH